MIKYGPQIVALTIVLGAGAACTGNPLSPTPPSAAPGGTSAVNADGSTLKSSSPAIIAPVDDERVDGRRPTFVWLNARLLNAAVGLAYEIVVVDAAGNEVYQRIVGETLGSGSHTLELELGFDTAYSWRIRAVLGSDAGPWSISGAFRTPLPPPPPPPTTPTPTPGTIGPARTISLSEAFSIIVSIHDGGGFNLGSSSSRGSRVAFFFGAVAAIHYGHARWNPGGPDTNWCVKDAGGGRPASDDVIVRCSTREAWDLISGVGGNGYSFHADFIGTLGSSHNVYEPGRGALGNIPQ